MSVANVYNQDLGAGGSSGTILPIPVVSGWDNVLSVNNLSGASNPIISSPQSVIFSSGIKIGEGGTAPAATNPGTNIAIGKNAGSANIESIIIGHDSVPSGDEALIIGSLAGAANKAITVGRTGSALARAVAVGYGADARTSSVAIGTLAGSANYSVNIGDVAATSGANTVTIGYAANTNNAIDSVAVGYQVSIGTDSTDSIVIGSGANMSNKCDSSILIGKGAAIATIAPGNTVIGKSASIATNTFNSVIVGKSSTIGQSSEHSTITGSGSSVGASSTNNSICGYSSTIGDVSVNNSVLGSLITVGAGCNNNVICGGNDTMAGSSVGNSILGDNNQTGANALYNVACGYNTDIGTNATYNTVIGYSSSAALNTDNTITVGNNCRSTADNSILIGTDTSTGAGINSIVISSGSITGGAAPNVVTIAAGGNPTYGAARSVSVGSSNTMRSLNRNYVFGYNNSDFAIAGATDNIMIGSNQILATGSGLVPTTRNIGLGDNVVIPEGATDSIYFSRAVVINGSISVGSNANFDNINNRLYPLISSRKAKTNIIDLPNPERVLNLRPVQYNAKKGYCLCTNGCDGNCKNEIGFIAEEVEEAGLSEVVVYTLGENGEKEVMSMSYERLVSPMLAILKKHEARIKELETELQLLKL